MCDYIIPSNTRLMSIASMLMVASHTLQIECFSCREVVKLWENAYTFTYHAPNQGGDDYTVDYIETLRYFATEIEAATAMANHVWGLNSLLHEINRHISEN